MTNTLPIVSKAVLNEIANAMLEHPYGDRDDEKNIVSVWFKLMQAENPDLEKAVRALAQATGQQKRAVLYGAALTYACVRGQFLAENVLSELPK